MGPIAGWIAGYPLHTFTLALDAAVACGLATAALLARRRGLPVAGFVDAALVALVAALLGSRAQYVAAHWSDYAASPMTVLNVWEGGLALPGAITAGGVAARWAARWTRIPAPVALDAAAPALALGQAIGRLGCIPAGCAAGSVVPADSSLPSLLLPDSTGLVAARFPSQAFEAGGELLLAALLVLLWRRRPPAAAVAASYLAGYGLLRLLLEPFRIDSTFVGPLALASWWSLGAVAAGVLVLARLARQVRHRSLGERVGLLLEPDG